MNALLYTFICIDIENMNMRKHSFININIVITYLHKINAWMEFTWPSLIANNCERIIVIDVYFVVLVRYIFCCQERYVCVCIVKNFV